MFFEGGGGYLKKCQEFTVMHMPYSFPFPFQHAKSRIDTQFTPNYRAEVQRDEALQNFIDAQETLEDYQRKAKDKTRKVNAKNNFDVAWKELIKVQ